jgi:hypothetical protein
MHEDHDHGHGHDHAHDHHHPHDHGPHDHGHGHNHARRPVQWQTPHLPEGAAKLERQTPELDFDLVETAFVESFTTCSDPTSFLRLAGVPFTGTAPDGATLSLLRVELDHATDVGTVTPHLGGGTFRYDPLPTRMVSRRRRLRLAYHDGTAVRGLTLAEAKALTTG